MTNVSAKFHLYKHHHNYFIKLKKLYDLINYETYVTKDYSRIPAEQFTMIPIDFHISKFPHGIRYTSFAVTSHQFSSHVCYEFYTIHRNRFIEETFMLLQIRHSINVVGLHNASKWQTIRQ